MRYFFIAICINFQIIRSFDFRYLIINNLKTDMFAGYKKSPDTFSIKTFSSSNVFFRKSVAFLSPSEDQTDLKAFQGAIHAPPQREKPQWHLLAML